MSITTRESAPSFERESVSKALAALVVEIEEDLHQRLEEGKTSVAQARARFEKDGGQAAPAPEQESWQAWLSEHLSHSELGPALAYERLQAHHRRLVTKGQTNEKWGDWTDDQLAQVAVGWVLSLTFLRYLEDQGYLRKSYVGGTDETRAQAENRRLAYLREHDEHGEREFFLDIFTELARLPGCLELFGQEHSPLWLMGPSSDGARRLWEAFREHDPGSGVARWSFAGADTRFLGDLYQNLSKSAREKFALLQTPDFVEEFILDHTLKPAWETFGPEETRMIDPACGSGHFLLGSFWRYVHYYAQANVRAEKTELARKALTHVHGVDLNPFAVAIARFRLLLAALDVCEARDLAGAWAFDIPVAVGDSLLCGERFHSVTHQGELGIFGSWNSKAPDEGFSGRAEQLLSQRYEAVVANPPYITDSDKAHSARLRSFYKSAYKQFHLSLPFIERSFELAVHSPTGGYVGIITDNAFMKREYGSRFVEEVFPELDITHVIDSDGAYIPGHGTPTAILFGRNRLPDSSLVRAVLGVRGEPCEPVVPAEGLRWSSIVKRVNGPETEDAFVTVVNLERARLFSHPWVIGGGGAIELYDHLISSTTTSLEESASQIGFITITGEDDLLTSPPVWLQSGQDFPTRPIASGKAIRDFRMLTTARCVWPYNGQEAVLSSSTEKYLWPYRTNLRARKKFGIPMSERGLPWFEIREVYWDKLNDEPSIAFAEVSSHNHLYLDTENTLFSQTAPVIKLRSGGTTGSEYYRVLGLFSSSVGNFFCRQTCFPKGGDSVGTEGARVSKNPWEDRLQRASAAMGKFPLASSSEELILIARRLVDLARAYKFEITDREGIHRAEADCDRVYRSMVALQEELDWHVYGLYGLHPSPPSYPIDQLPPLVPGERAFEIVLARLVEQGVENDLWFTRHGITPRTTLPEHWPEDYREVVQQRIDLIENERFFKLLETPVHKRRWSREAWPDLVKRKLKERLLDHLESEAYWPEPRIRSCSELARQAASDREFVNWAQLYTGAEDPHLGSLVADLVQSQGVPYLDGLVYKAPGLRKRARWKETWALQRREDAGESVDIPVPPKYAAGDFLANYYEHRGKLDVPKERFILYPGLDTTEDPTMRIGWAGWNHEQRAQALAARIESGQSEEGWGADRLLPLLAGLGELLPWLKQWHNDIDPRFALRLGDYYESYAVDEARRLGFTLADVAKALPEVKKAKPAKKAAAKPPKSGAKRKKSKPTTEDQS